MMGVDNLSTGNLANLAQLQREPRFNFEEHDICQPFDPGRVDFVHNFASPASPVDYSTLGVETLRVGSLGTLNMLELARRYDSDFLMASTSECYGDPLEHPQRESYFGNVNPNGPRSVYDEAKRFAEAATAAYYRYYKVRTRIVRIFNTYGPRMRPSDGRVIPNFMMQALRNEPLTIHGDGSQTRSFCFINDEVEGILRLAGISEPRPVNIGNPEEFTVRQCAELVLKVTDSSSPIISIPLPEDDPKRRCPDISRARHLLNWSPKISLEAGLAGSLDYFKEIAERKLGTSPLSQ